MTTQTLVFRLPIEGSHATHLVFESPVGTGGALYTPTIPEIVQDPALDVTVAAITASHPINVTFQLQPELTVTTEQALTFALTQAPDIETWAATEILSIGEFTQDPALTYLKADATTFAIAQAPSLDVTADFVSGSAHSTFFKTATIAQAPVLSIQHGSQTHFSLTQRPVLSFDEIVDVGGIFTTVIPVDIVQRPVLSALTEPQRVGGTHYVGGWTQVVPYPRQPTKGELRLAAKAKEKEERKRLAILAAERIKQEEAARQAEMERIRVMVDQMSMVDAAFRPQYEAQIQQLQQALMASEMEIARLRQQVAQTLQ